MGLPVVFLAGFLALFAGHSFVAPLPGSCSAASLAWSALLWPLPALFAACAMLVARRQLVAGRIGLLPPRALLRASAITSPAAIYTIGVHGGWLDLAWQLGGDSHLLTLVLAGVPLFAVELPRMVFALVAATWLEGDGAPFRGPGGHELPSLRDVWPVLRARFGWPLLLPLPVLILGGALDLLRLHREAYSFVLGTSPGVSAGMLGMVVVFGAVLPWWFGFAFGLVPHLPEPTGTVLRRTAAALGFPPDRVVQLPTGGRSMNAMMIGPLRTGRRLCLTDGLLRALDDELLAGVVAHEVGHARMGHPALLVLLTGVVPVLLLSPIASLGLGDCDPLWQALWGIVAIAAVWSIVRTLAHRFEHEADVASVQALGAGPCSRALMAVSRAALPVRQTLLGRVTSLHPEERTRCTAMLRYEYEPEFRAAFDARGRRVRAAILAGTAFAAVLAGIAWWRDWPYEQVVWRLDVGDVAGASETAAEIGDNVPPHWQHTWKLVREDLAAAVAVAPAARDWEAAEPGYTHTAWRRGIAVLLAQGPAAARPWFALAATADAVGEERILRALLHEYCRASEEGETDRLQEVRQVLRRRGVPAELEPVFRE